MENFSYYVPVYVANAGVATSGHSADLRGGQVGLFDRDTFSVATSSGNGKEFYFAQSTLGGFDWYGDRISETSHKSPFFYGKDVEKMYMSKPSRRSNEEWIVGYNGAESSVGITYKKDAEPVKIKFLFTGGPTYRFFGGPKEYVVSYSVPLDCTDDCNQGCTGDALDPLKYVKEHIDLINHHTELRKFGVTADLIADSYSATTTNMTKYQLTICDEGDGVALQAVIAQAPVGADVKKVSRVNSTSTYEICISDEDDAPADFVLQGSIKAAICNDCADFAGSTYVPAVDYYLINRPLAGTENLTDDSAKATYAAAVAAAYGAADVATVPTTDVNITDNIITETSHNYITGQAVVYDDGGATAITGLTDGTTYYVIVVDANSYKLATTAANALAGTAIDISGTGNNAQTFSPSFSSSFLINTGATALVKIAVPNGHTVTPLLSDIVTFSNTEAATCVLAAPTPISWVESGTGIRSKRTMKINQLKRPECDADGNRLADLEDILTPVVGIDLESLTLIAGDGCFDDYTVEQWSVDCLSEEECMTNVVSFKYADLPSVEGQSWYLVPEDVVEDLDRKVGIRITANYEDIRFGNDSFKLLDYYETEPLKMEVAIWREWAGACDVSTFPSVVRSKYGSFERQSGEYVVREMIMKTDAYQRHIRQFSESPRMREAFDMNLLNMVDRNAFYNIYYITYKASYGKLWRKNEQEKFTTVFCFKEDDPRQATFKTNVIDVLTAKSGTTFHINE
jgi:hypothetical protein